MFKDNQNTMDDTKTIIGASVSVEGDFNGKGDVIIEGKLKGSVKTGQNITIGEQAVVEAEIKAANAFIAGVVKGNINVKEKLELTKTAQIFGNINSKSISIEDGAIFNGQCTMKQDNQTEKNSPEEEPQK